jgi:RNA 2',3'-cyclic 3'-phosphodiesterase
MRLFIASEVAASVRSELGSALAPLRSSLPAASWGRSGTLHLTWAFVGEQPDSSVQPIHEELLPRFAGRAPIEVTLGGVGAFPSDRSIRVVVLGLEPADPLRAIAAAVRSALDESGIDFDRKAFKPHLTLARPRERWSRRDLDAIETALRSIREKSFTIESVSIFSSKLSPSGATHTEMRRAAFTIEAGAP